MKKTIIVMIMLCSSGIALAQDGIVFLHLRFNDNTITLMEAHLRPGTVKQPRTKSTGNNIDLEVLSHSGAILFTTSIKDPSFQRYEYEDPNNSGVLISKDIQQNDVSFVERIPYNKEATRIRFYRNSFTASPSGSRLLKKVFIGTAELSMRGLK